MFIRHLFKQYEALTFASNREGIFLIRQKEVPPTFILRGVANKKKVGFKGEGGGS